MLILSLQPLAWLASSIQPLARLADLLLGWMTAILYRSFAIGLVHVFSAVRISILDLIHSYVDVVLFTLRDFSIVVFWYADSFFCRADILLHLSHMSFWCFIRLWIILVDLFYCQSWPWDTVACPDGLDPSFFRRVSCTCMYLSDELLCAWKFVSTVYRMFRTWPIQ